ncbi:MAG: cobalamin B12-binding domain-containing protein [Lentisphaerae bacterium]|nr:cobalamin B12-binding domain-containing protein [Lentisphaerota bacterium]
MKVLLVQSHLGRSESGPPVFPLGLCYLATVLTRHTVKILDLNLWTRREADEVLSRTLLEQEPDVVGLSIRNIDTTQRGDIFYYFNEVQPTARLIKRTRPGALLIAGGSGFSIFPRKIMERIPEFDLGVFLEAEDSLPELLDRLDSPGTVKGVYFRHNGSVAFSGARALPDFARLPIPRRDREVIDITAYMRSDGGNIGIQSKRGCCLACAYCNYPHLSGNQLRMRAPEQVADEVQGLLGLGVRRFCFVDNIFNVPRPHAEAVCRELIRRNLDVEWSAWFEVKNTTRELVELARRAGCKHFGFSPDAATDRGLSRLGKGITESDLKRSYRVIRESHGIRAGYNFFILPGMSFREIFKTLTQVVWIPLVTKGKARVMGLGWIRIEPDTEIYRRAVAEGSLAKDAELLPEQHEALSRLFYYDRAHRRFDTIVAWLFRWLDTRLRPIIKRFVRKSRSP